MKKIIVIMLLLLISVNLMSGCKKVASESEQLSETAEKKEIPDYVLKLREVYSKLYTEEYTEAYCYYSVEEQNAYIVLLQHGVISDIVENILLLRGDGTSYQLSLGGYITTDTQDISVRGISSGEIKIAVNNIEETNIYTFSIEDTQEAEATYAGSLYKSFLFDITVEEFDNKIAEVEWD